MSTSQRVSRGFHRLGVFVAASMLLITSMADAEVGREIDQSNIGVPFSMARISPRWSTCLDFLAQMNLVASMLSQSRWAT